MNAPAEVPEVVARWRRFYELVARRQAACLHATGAVFAVGLRSNPRYGDHHGIDPWLPPYRGCARCGLREEASRFAGFFRFNRLDELDELVETVSHEEGMRRILEAKDLVRRYVGLEGSLVGPRRGPKRSPNRPGVAHG